MAEFFNEIEQGSILKAKELRNSMFDSFDKQQCNEHNALQAFMISTSILVTTQKLGKGWLRELAI